MIYYPQNAIDNEILVDFDYIQTKYKMKLSHGLYIFPNNSKYPRLFGTKKRGLRALHELLNNLYNDDNPYHYTIINDIINAKITYNETYNIFQSDSELSFISLSTNDIYLIQYDYLYNLFKNSNLNDNQISSLTSDIIKNINHIKI